MLSQEMVGMLVQTGSMQDQMGSMLIQRASTPVQQVESTVAQQKNGKVRGFVARFASMLIQRYFVGYRPESILNFHVITLYPTWQFTRCWFASHLSLVSSFVSGEGFDFVLNPSICMWMMVVRLIKRDAS